MQPKYSILEKQYFSELTKLFEDWAGEKAHDFKHLPQSGSYREYYRISGHSKKAIGVYNSDQKENIAFLTFSKHFSEKDIPVPSIYAEGSGGKTYLISDLGETTLFNLVTERRKKTRVFPGSAIKLYKKALEQLPRLQITASADLNYKVCYPRQAFDRQSMMWDLNYFKYYFLKLARVPFDEQLLENDYQNFCDFLLQADDDYFLYRDFQSRNIMISENQTYFIDYQGGRKGALQYDVASLLYDSKANIPQEIKNLLLRHYLKTLHDYLDYEEEEFLRYYHGFALIRLMQAMGAYGFRGFYERKTEFLQSIPYALRQMKVLVEKYDLPVQLPHLHQTLQRMLESKGLKKYTLELKSVTHLNIDINSFAYKNGIPKNKYGHGGGFVFDCRFLTNPGRYEQYQDLTGKDQQVIEFLQNESEVDSFLQATYEILDMTIEKYLSRGFSHMQVNFGCTGGQHRSVYCAENLKAYLNEKYERQVISSLHHLEKHAWK